jgi:DNA-binding transcriptional LysR family regulator
MQDLANIREDSLTINVMNSKLLPSLFISFYCKRPNIKIHQYTLKDDQALQRLIEGTLDLMIIPNRISNERILWEPLFDEELF